VSQEFARATVRFMGTFLYGSQFMNVCLSITRFPVHWMSSSGVSMPSWSAASAVIGLNVDPGGKRPETARFKVGLFSLGSPSALIFLASRSTQMPGS
jgi:hypothetical protein